jgi:hypothetical protein
MNRKILLLSTALLAAMMLSLAVAPAMAKPYSITVTVKNSDTNKTQPGVGVYVMLYTSNPAQEGVRMPEIGSSTTDSHGKVTLSWLYDEQYPYDHFDLYVGNDLYDTYSLNPKQSARVTAWVTPS